MPDVNTDSKITQFLWFLIENNSLNNSFYPGHHPGHPGQRPPGQRVSRVMSGDPVATLVHIHLRWWSPWINCNIWFSPLLLRHFTTPSVQSQRVRTKRKSHSSPLITATLFPPSILTQKSARLLLWRMFVTPCLVLIMTCCPNTYDNDRSHSIALITELLMGIRGCACFWVNAVSCRVNRSV